MIATAQAQTACTVCKGTLDNESRLCLPERVEGASTIGIRHEGKALHNPVGAAYQAMRNRLSVSLVFYDRQSAHAEADDEEMRATVRQVLDAHRDAKLEMGGTTALPIGGDPTAGEAAWITWSEGFTQYASVLWLLPHGPRWLKIHATYLRPSENAGEAAESALGFVRSVTNAICRVD